MIPKIVHQLAPVEEKWHPVWRVCHPTWKNNFPDFDHKMWGDDEIDSFIENNFSDWFWVYEKFPTHILKLDFARLAILYQYGGIYADMDMYCYRNFYEELKDGINLIQSNGIKNVDCNEHVQNSLMCSDAKNEFFLECMNEACEGFLEREYALKYAYERRNQIPALSHYYSECILQITGPVMLSDMYEKYPTLINVLPRELYNDNIKSHNTEYRTKHMMTGMWGTDFIEQLDGVDLAEHYKSFRGIDMTRFNFDEKYK
jgi:mannosyltransferase OCH1-like enzyme